MSPISRTAVMPAQRTNGPAVLSLICGVLGCLPFFTGICAIVFGVVGLMKARVPGMHGRGMSIAGIVLGLISLGGWTLFSGTLWALIVGTNVNRELSEQFINDLRTTSAATAPANEGLLDAKREEYGAELANLKDVSHTETVVRNNEAVLQGVITLFSGETRYFSARQEKIRGRWKVTNFDLVQKPVN